AEPPWPSRSLVIPAAAAGVVAPCAAVWGDPIQTTPTVVIATMATERMNVRMMVDLLWAMFDGDERAARVRMTNRMSVGSLAAGRARPGDDDRAGRQRAAARRFERHLQRFRRPLFRLIDDRQGVAGRIDMNDAERAPDAVMARPGLVGRAGRRRRE